MGNVLTRVNLPRAFFCDFKRLPGDLRSVAILLEEGVSEKSDECGVGSTGAYLGGTVEDRACEGEGFRIMRCGSGD